MLNNLSGKTKELYNVPPLMVNQTETQEPALTAEEFSKHFMSMADESAGEFNRKTVIDFIRKYKTSSTTGLSSLL